MRLGQDLFLTATLGEFFLAVYSQRGDFFGQNIIVNFCRGVVSDDRAPSVAAGRFFV